LLLTLLLTLLLLLKLLLNNLTIIQYEKESHWLSFFMPIKIEISTGNLYQEKKQIN